MEDVQSTAGWAKIQANFRIAKGAALKVADAVEKVLPLLLEYQRHNMTHPLSDPSSRRLGTPPI